jgi:hypothetical protein
MTQAEGRRGALIDRSYWRIPQERIGILRRYPSGTR